MGSINYTLLEEQMIKRVAGIRAEYISKNNSIGNEALDAMSSVIVDYSAKNHSNYVFVNKSVDKYIYEMVEKIVITLFSEKKIPVSTGFTINTNAGPQKVRIMEMFEIYKSAPLFAIIKVENNKPVLYLFKEYGLQNRLPESVITDVASKLGVSDYHYISLVEENAYSEIINHNDDVEDASRGTNVFSFRDFFVDNFGEDEYREFKRFIGRLNSFIKECLGYSVVKTLTPNAMFSFKKEVEAEIINYPYYESMVNDDGITYEQLEQLKSQYIDNKYYMAVLNEGDFNSRFNVEGCQFAESFITSEWLYQSIPESGKMDLTAIAMGYFKSIEQMLYTFTFSHVGENKWIDTWDRPDNWETIPARERRWQSQVNANTVKSKKTFIMLERMINFVKDYDDMFNDVSTRDYLVERLHDAQQLRNGYFHKDNLSETEKVKKARDDAFVIYLLLFGSITASSQAKAILGIPEDDIQFDMLSEYVHCNSAMTYYFEEDGQMVVALGQNDEGVTYSRDGIATYTGIYMNKLVGMPAEKEVITLKEAHDIKKERISFDKSTVPAKIYKGTFVTCKEGILISGPKTLIWDNGIFICNM